MQKFVLSFFMGVTALWTASAALTNAMAPWGAVSGDAAKLAFADYIGNTQDTGYAHPGRFSRSASERSEGTVGAFTMDLDDSFGEEQFLELIYLGGSSNHLREFGFDVSFGGMSAEVTLTDPLLGDSADKIPLASDDLGRVFKLSVREIVELVGGDPDDPAAELGIRIDLFTRKVVGGRGVGLDGQKVLASDGIAVFDYSPFVAPGLGMDPYSMGVAPGSGGAITPVPGGFPEGINRVWGWEDQLRQTGVGYRLGGGDSEFNDFMMGFYVHNFPRSPMTSVPEPSSYGLIGVAALVGLILRRRLGASRTDGA